MNDRVKQYLASVKKLSLLMTERRALCCRLCPGLLLPDDEKKDCLAALSRVYHDIETELNNMATIETGTPPLGASALVDSPSSEMRLTVSLLVVSRLSPTAFREFDRVGEIMENVAGEDPSIAFTVRQMFTLDGEFRPFVKIDYEQEDNCDRWFVSLPDRVFSQILGETPDAEAIAMSVLSVQDISRRYRKR